MNAKKKLTLGERLRRERKNLNWSQDQLAREIGTSALSINRWEHDKTIPRPYYRKQLCRVFNISAEALFNLQDDEEGEKLELPSIWSVPHLRNLYFTDREHVLAYLHDTLTARKTTSMAQTCAINGLGGIGKTQTAVEYAYRYGAEYNAVLWAKADSHQSLVSEFVALAEPLNLPEKEDADQTRVVNAIKYWLQRHPRWLLILDNADDLDIVYEFLPALGEGHTILTTRSQATGPNIKGIELEKLRVEEGLLFLLRRSKFIAEDTPLERVPDTVRREAEAIYEQADGLPLALDQAAAYIEENQCSLADYLNLYQTRRAILLNRRGSFSKRDYPNSVATTWSLSFERVEEADPIAANLLRLCTFLHSEAIPEEMIIAGAAELGPVLQPIAEDALRLGDALGELRKYSLVRRNPETKSLTIHQLVQTVLKDTMDSQTQREWAVHAVQLVNRAFPNTAQVRTWPECQQCLPHAQVCAELIEQWDMSFPQAAQLLNRAGAYLYERGQYSASEQLLKRALSMGEQLLDEEEELAESLYDLGVLYYAQGKYEQGEPLLQRALSIREQALRPDHPKVADSLTGLAWVYQGQGKYELAEPLLQRALSIREHEFGLIHHDVAESLNELGGFYHNQGKYKQAELLYRQSLSILEQIEEANHPDIAKALNNLAVINRKQGKYEQAEPLFLQAHSILEGVLGPTHPDIVTIVSNLAKLYQAQGKSEQAEPLFHQVLSAREEVLGPNHPKVATSLHDMAKLFQTQGKYAEAEQLFQRALSTMEQSLREKHPDMATTLKDYAALLREQGRETEALPLEERAKTITNGPM
ncbi:MAG: FxSxx-COOH system tetratricopeptide repeat protein [Ktedonobacteraceae bacterium]